MSYQFFDIILSDNDKRKSKGIKLNNGIKIALISDPYTNPSSCCIGVGAGSNNDTREGIAHFLEHLLFLGSEKYPDHNHYHQFVLNNGGVDNAFTSDKCTCYFLTIGHEPFENALEILSWFFRKPLLDVKFIKSESQIVNSEHHKNINSDKWITDNLFKKFIKNKKFNKFSTGNNESLKNISKDEIFDFYNKYYTTDNYYVSIVDTLTIDEMIQKYVKIFDEIPKSKPKNLPKQEKLELINDNLIIYSSSLERKYLNIYLLLECNEKNINDLQLLNILNYLIGLEYYNSLCYKFKENNLTNEVLVTVDHYYDEQALMTTNITVKNEKNIEMIMQCFYNYITKMYNMTFEDFCKIYKNFQNIKKLKLLYKNKDDSQKTAITAVENMIKNYDETCLINQFVINECDENIYQRFLHIINTCQIKYVTNCNILNIPSKEFIKDNYYNTKYVITNYDIKLTTNVEFDFNQCIIIDNIDGILNSSINFKNEAPKLIENTDKRLVYHLNTDKNNKPQSNITIIRKNNNLLDKKNREYFDIYCEVIKSLLNYYLDPLIDYDMNFKMFSENNNCVFIFNGFNTFIYDYMKKIFELIYTSLFNLENIEASFNRVINEMKENILESKNNVPYVACSDYIDTIIKNEMKPVEIIKFLDKITFDEFKKMYDHLFTYYKEVILIVGTVNSDKIIKTLPQNNLLTSKTKTDYKLNTKFNYTITEKNKEDKNNCIVCCYFIKDFHFKDKKEKNEMYSEISKYTMIVDIISQLINEPLFNQLRTVEKLGYIVRCKSFVYSTPHEISLTIQYMVQSSYNVKKLLESINKFNKNLEKTFLTFEKKFESLKKSILKILESNFKNHKTGYYRNLLLNEIYDFNIYKKVFEEAQKISFNDIIKIFETFLKTNPSIVQT